MTRQGAPHQKASTKSSGTATSQQRLTFDILQRSLFPQSPDDSEVDASAAAAAPAGGSGELEKYLSVQHNLKTFRASARGLLTALPFVLADVQTSRKELEQLVVDTLSPDSGPDYATPSNSEDSSVSQPDEVDTSWPAVPTPTPTASLRLLSEACQFSQSKDEVIETLFESPSVVLGTDFLSADNQPSERGPAAIRGFTRVLHNDKSLRQEAKDIQRDRITVNGVAVSENGGRSYDEIVTDFQQIIERLFKTAVYGQAIMSADFDGSHVTNICRSLAMMLLHAGNRTQSGGASFTQVLGLFTTPCTIVAPVSDLADPLTFEVSMGTFRTTPVLGGADDGTAAEVKWGLRCHVRANSYYKICDSNPSDESTSTWAVVKAQYDSWFGQDLTPSAIARYHAAATDTVTGRSVQNLSCQSSAIEKGAFHIATAILMKVCTVVLIHA